MQQRYEDLDETEPPMVDEASPVDAPAPRPPLALRVVMGVVVTVCVATTLTHVSLVFLHVAPLNPISQRYNRQIAAWINPLFQQNWLLFAPNPDTNQTQIFASTGWTTASGDSGVSDWFDISAVDKADTKHNPYPSRTAQHMLRRACSAYLITHVDQDAPSDKWTLIWEKYLRNIAVQRVAAHSTHPFQRIRLKIVTQAIAPPDADATTKTYSPNPDVRLLPWWNVTPDGN